MRWLSLFLACQHLNSVTNLRECEDQTRFKVQAVPVFRSDWCKCYWSVTKDLSSQISSRGLEPRIVALELTKSLKTRVWRHVRRTPCWSGMKCKLLNAPIKSFGCGKARGPLACFCWPSPQQAQLPHLVSRLFYPPSPSNLFIFNCHSSLRRSAQLLDVSAVVLPLVRALLGCLHALQSPVPILNTKKTPWPESASELYRDGFLRPYSRLSRPESLLFLWSSSSIVLTRLSGPRSRPTTSQKIW
jgi:hypothetical protein